MATSRWSARWLLRLYRDFLTAIDKYGRVSEDARGMLYAGGIASPFGNGKAAPSIIYGGTGDLPWVRPISSKASIKRAMGAVAVGMLTPFSRSSRPSCARRYIFNPAINRVVVSKLIYFCLPATLNLP